MLFTALDLASTKAVQIFVGVSEAPAPHMHALSVNHFTNKAPQQCTGGHEALSGQHSSYCLTDPLPPSGVGQSLPKHAFLELGFTTWIIVPVWRDGLPGESGGESAGRGPGLHRCAVTQCRQGMPRALCPVQARGQGLAQRGRTGQCQLVTSVCDLCTRLCACVCWRIEFMCKMTGKLEGMISSDWDILIF